MEMAKFAVRAGIAAWILFLFGRALFFGDSLNESLLDVLIALASTAVGYFLGSSQGSNDKDRK